MSNSKQDAHPEHIETEVKRSQALELRIGGANYREIARAIGISPSTAHDYVVSGLREIRDDNAALTEEVRALELQRCESIIKSLWLKRDQPRVADTILRTIERKARLLGLDAPFRWEGSGPGGGPIPVADGQLDLGKLSLDELRALETMIVRQQAEVRASAPVATLADSAPAAIPAQTSSEP